MEEFKKVDNDGGDAWKTYRKRMITLIDCTALESLRLCFVCSDGIDPDGCV